MNLVDVVPDSLGDTIAAETRRGSDPLGDVAPALVLEREILSALLGTQATLAKSFHALVPYQTKHPAMWHPIAYAGRKHSFGIVFGRNAAPFDGNTCFVEVSRGDWTSPSWRPSEAPRSQLASPKCEILGLVNALNRGLFACPTDIRHLADAALSRLDQRKDEDIEEWARQLAEHVADGCD
jgi:hypothetical protein